MQDPSISRWRHGVWLIVGLWLALWVLRLSVPDDLVERDQQRQSAYIMDAWGNGRWSAQADFRADIASKPPLYNWLGAAAVAMVGPGHLAVTAPAALSTLCLALLAWYWAKSLWGAGAGLLAGVLMLLPIIGPKMVAYVRTDGLFAATVALTAYAWWRAWEHGRSAWWAWLAALLATLVKGPLGLVLGSLGLLAIAWERWSPQPAGVSSSAARGLSWRALAGLPVFLLLTGGWFWWAWSDWGQPLVDRMIFRELVGHAISSHDASGGLGSTVWKAPLYFLGRTVPWGLVTVLALVRIFRRPDPDPSRRRAERFLTCWLLGGIVIFALASHQRGDLIWPVVLPGAVLAAPELARLATGWPDWSRRWLGPVLVAVVLAVHVFYQGTLRRSEASVRSNELALAIRDQPGRYFPVSFAVKYATQIPLGLNRYLTAPEQYIPALLDRPAVYVAVSEPRRVVQQVHSAGGRAEVLLETGGGWGVVANRPDWTPSVATRLLMGPLVVTVEHARWLELRGRTLRISEPQGQLATVTVSNTGPHTERFTIEMEAAGTSTPWTLRIEPATGVVASWQADLGWRNSASEAVRLPFPGKAEEEAADSAPAH
jgi:4-amino-4-deoxy-L-arabinose transferase-like glycosyltransferase